MDRPNMRFALARALGLGSAKEGAGPWLAERLSAVALVPLTLGFAASIIAHSGSDYTTFIAWMRSPIAATLMILLLIALFHHTALGLQVVTEDYVHSKAMFAWVIAVRLGCFVLASTGADGIYTNLLFFNDYICSLDSAHGTTLPIDAATAEALRPRASLVPILASPAVSPAPPVCATAPIGAMPHVHGAGIG